MAKVLRGTSRGLGDFSKLPDELLIYIISLLPFKDAVRTSMLSTRWRYLYASISNIHFNFEGGNGNLIGFQNVVDKLFELRSSRCLVDKFSLSDSVSKDLNPLCIQRWTQSVMWHGVRQLILIIPYTVMVPSSLCTCKTLEFLKLAMGSLSGGVYKRNKYPLFEVPVEIILPSLKVLHLLEVAYADNECVNRLISNCPVLEKFVIHLWDDDCKLSVSSTALKFLSIQHNCSKGWSGGFDIVINAPNIGFLRYSVSGVTSQTLVLGPALTDVSYDLQVHRDHSHYFRNAAHFMRLIQNIKKLIICDDILKDLQEFNIPLPVFKNLTYLKMFSQGFGSKGLPYLLARCESLKLIEFVECCVWNSNPDDWIPLEEPRVSCLTSHLETVEFNTFKPEDNQIEAVKFFLKSARVLKRVEINLCNEVDANSEIVKDLTMLPRISEECEVAIFQEDLLVCLSQPTIQQ